MICTYYNIFSTYFQTGIYYFKLYLNKGFKLSSNKAGCMVSRQSFFTESYAHIQQRIIFLQLDILHVRSFGKYAFVISRMFQIIIGLIARIIRYLINIIITDHTLYQPYYL